MQIVLISLTPSVTQKDLYLLAAPLEINGRHCADYWGGPRPAVDVGAREYKLPPGAVPIFFVDGEGLGGSAAAFHYFDPLRGKPAARVYVGKSTGFNEGANSVAELASHELVEALVDPKLDKWFPHPTRELVDVAVEVADPVQTHYLVWSRNVAWRMCNFITPAYFRRDLARSENARMEFFAQGFRFDWAGELRMPGEVGPAGYTTLRQRAPVGGWRVWLENASSGAPEWSEEQRIAKAHVLSRTLLRSASLDGKLAP